MTIIWLSNFSVHKYNFYQNTATLFVYILPMTDIILQWQSWIIVTETIWPASQNIFYMALYRKSLLTPANRGYLWTLKFEFCIIFICYKILLFFWFFKYHLKMIKFLLLLERCTKLGNIWSNLGSHNLPLGNHSQVSWKAKKKEEKKTFLSKVSQAHVGQ